jgi:Uma2 family endonuclease
MDVSHARVVKKINRLLPEEQFTIGVQDPITLVDDSEPEPDLHVTRGPLENNTHQPRPGDILLVVEVSDTPLSTDRSVKKLNYASAGIEEYWIVNIYEKQAERYTDPRPERGNYTGRQLYRVGETIDSLHPGAFAVGDLVG